MTSTHPWDGARAWATSHQNGRPGASAPIVTLGCASARYCLATGIVFNFPVLLRTTEPRRLSAYSWRPALNPEPRSVVTAESCVASRFCALATAFADSPRQTTVVTSNGPAKKGRSEWTRSTLAGRYLSISCASPRFCVAVGVTNLRAVGGSGRVVVGTG